MIPRLSHQLEACAELFLACLPTRASYPQSAEAAVSSNIFSKTQFPLLAALEEPQHVKHENLKKGRRFKKKKKVFWVE